MGIILLVVYTQLAFYLNIYRIVGNPGEHIYTAVFVCVEVLRPSQPNGVMSRAVSLPNHTFTGQA